MLVQNGHLLFFYATIEEASMRRLLVTTIGAEDGNFVTREIQDITTSRSTEPLGAATPFPQDLPIS